MFFAGVLLILMCPSVILFQNLDVPTVMRGSSLSGFEQYASAGDCCLIGGCCCRAVGRRWKAQHRDILLNFDHIFVCLPPAAQFSFVSLPGGCFWSNLFGINVQRRQQGCILDFSVWRLFSVSTNNAVKQSLICYTCETIPDYWLCLSNPKLSKWQVIWIALVEHYLHVYDWFGIKQQSFLHFSSFYYLNLNEFNLEVLY